MMNSRFDFEAFGSQPFEYEQEDEFASQPFEYESEGEEEIRRVPMRRGAIRRSALARRKPAAARKLASILRRRRRRPRPPMRPTPQPRPFPFWPGFPPDPSQDPQQTGQDLGSANGSAFPGAEPPSGFDGGPSAEGSERVRWMQTSLNQLLQTNLPVDGVMNAATRSAVRSFQSKNNLPATGVIGPDTEQALVAATQNAGGVSKGVSADAGAPPAAGAEQELHQELPWMTSYEFDEFEVAAACPTFTPTPIETPGGGRVKNKTSPAAGDLVRVKRAYGKTVPLHRLAARALEALQCAARAEGIKAPLLQPTSGFRDPKVQNEAWQRALKRYGSAAEARKWVAPPGSSAHQSGRAIDFYLGGSNSSGNVAQLRTTRAYRWLAANAKRFGFYPYEREPWHWEYNPPSSLQSEFGFESQEFEGEFEDEGVGPIAAPATVAAPKLIGQEQTPPGKTLYLKIPFGAEKPAKPMTGVFIPQHFRATPAVDVIIYLHGVKPQADLTINRYWNKKYFPTWPLREGLNQSGKNFILIAPTLGPRSQTQTGWLTKPGGLDKYLDQVLAALAAYGPYQGQRPQLGRIILACHSGGGLPMRLLAMGKNQCASRIKECWGFDCLYFQGDEDLWAKWSASRSDAKLFVYYQGSTRTRSEKLKQKRTPNIAVVRSSAKGHNWVPIHHWQERLTESLR